MGDIKGFKKFKREPVPTQDPVSRIENFKEFYKPTAKIFINDQAARCMDCGVPFCHNGCPLNNLIPDFNEAVYQENWKLAFEILNSTNNFPEFTGRICPAPCEGSCVLGINSDPVNIEFIEKTIAEKAFENNWLRPTVVELKTGNKIAIVGSGPAGLACAEQLNKVGHQVVIYEKADQAGGLLRYGIPDFKLEKNILDRRIKLMEDSGIEFVCGVEVGKEVSIEQLQKEYQAVVLCGGSTVPRDLPIPGRNLKGVHFAMEYLEQNNKRVAGQSIENEIEIKNKNIIVIGGGDTGSDCIGTSNRLGAKNIEQLEILGEPPVERLPNNPWPNWPMVLRESSSHEEGCNRSWSILSKEFVSEDGINVSGLKVVDVVWSKVVDLNHKMTPLAETERIIPCDKVFLAMGFLHPQKKGLLNQLGLELDIRGNVMAHDYQTSVPAVFAAGDMRRGQSLVVWAIAEGRECALAVDKYLNQGVSNLESNQVSVLAI